MTPEQLRDCLMRGENPYGELTTERWLELAAQGISDSLGYLTAEEWYTRALAHVDPQLAQRVLYDIDTVDWTKLRHAYGTAENIPTLLRAILTDDDLASYVVSQDLSDALVHEGIIYSASFHAVPFFFRLLTTDESWLHYNALLFFYSMAWATQPSEDEPPATQDSQRQVLAQHWHNWDAKWRQINEYRQQIHTALVEAIPQFRSFLNAPDIEVQELARELLQELTQAPTIDAS
jgi:hypothetical protein